MVLTYLQSFLNMAQYKIEKKKRSFGNTCSLIQGHRQEVTSTISARLHPEDSAPNINKTVKTSRWHTLASFRTGSLGGFV